MPYYSGTVMVKRVLLATLCLFLTVASGAWAGTMEPLPVIGTISTGDAVLTISLVPSGTSMPVPSIQVIVLDPSESALLSAAPAPEEQRDVEAAMAPPVSDERELLLVLRDSIEAEHRYGISGLQDLDVDLSLLLVASAGMDDSESYLRGPASNGFEEEEVAPPSWDQEIEETCVCDTVPDPFEPINRFFFHFNDKLYFWGIKPLAQGYNVVVPEWVRIRVRNVFQNILFPVRFVNSLLQLKFDGAGRELGRFLVNTTAGVGGMFDILVDNPDARPSTEDFGQTLGVYGVEEGFFMVLPFFGASSFRDTIGLGGDALLNPITYLFPVKEAVAVRAYGNVNATSLRIGDYEEFKESALDPYNALKDAYLQYRRAKIKQ